MSKSPLSPCGSDPTCPWLVVSQGTNLENHTSYNTSQNQTFNTNIPDLCNKQVALTSYGSWRALISYGWKTLTRVGDKSRLLDCCLFNTTSKDKIQLPHLEIDCSCSLNYECLLSKPPTDPDCYVMLMACWDEITFFCQIGEGKFTKMSKLIGEDYLSTAVNVDGKIYGLMTGSNSFVQIDFREQQLILEPLLVNNVPSSGHAEEFLLEFCNDILLVHMIYQRHSEPKDAAYFTIFKVNTRERKCSELRNIGEYAIFLGRHGSTSALCTRKSGVRKNSIYYYNDDKHLSVYDIEDRSKTLIKPCPIKGSYQSMSKNPFLMSWI